MTVQRPPCLRCQSPLEAGDLRCAVCGGKTPVEVADRDAVAAQVLRCGGCDAAVAYDPAVQGLKCAFCDSIMALQTIEDPMEQTAIWVPFTVDKDRASAALDAWLGRQGFFAPNDLREKAKLHALRPLFWVGWSFRARALVSWAADSDADSHRSAWAPHSGQTSMTFGDIVVSASRGLSDEEAYALVPHYDLNTAGPKPAEPAEAVFEQFDVQRSQARARVISAVDGVAAERLQTEGHIPGRKYRNVSVVPLIEGLETERYAFPAWVIAYRYKDTLYRAVVCGQDAGRVLGKAPTSALKVLMVVLGLALVLVFILAAITSS